MDRLIQNQINAHLGQVLFLSENRQKMGKYFTTEELVRSDSAISAGLDNTPGVEAAESLQRLIECLLDPLRELWGAPIRVNSGYRCAALNARVGGAKNSQHTKGQAADIDAGGPAKNKKLFEMILKSGLAFDQLIDEKDYRWLHVSYTPANRGQVLHLP